MNFRLPALLAAVLFSCLIPAAPAESWFQEAKRIRQDADATAPRSRSFEILPDFAFTADSVSAGASFKDHGERVIVRRAQIHVTLPVQKVQGRIIYKERARDQSYTGEPKWSAKWREPWAFGFFDYTVTATYHGNVYKGSFKVGKNGLQPSPR